MGEKKKRGRHSDLLDMSTSVGSLRFSSPNDNLKPKFLFYTINRPIQNGVSTTSE